MAMLDSLNTKGISRYEATLAYIAGTLSQGQPGATLAGPCAAFDHSDLCRRGGRGGAPHRRPPVDLTRGNLMGEILWQQRATTGDGQRAGGQALIAWRPAVGSPSSPYGRLCHGYCVLQFMPLRKTPPYATDERQTCCVSVWATTCCGAPLRHWWGDGERGAWCRPVLSPKFLQQGFRPPAGRPCQSPR